jgi:hypothetical protein
MTGRYFAALSMGLVACGTPMISDTSNDTIISGTVSGPSGPLNGAQVTVTVDSAASHPTLTALAATDAGGRYHARVVGFLLPPFRASARVLFAAPPGSGLHDSTLTDTVSFSQPPGQLVMDVTLR